MWEIEQVAAWVPNFLECFVATRNGDNSIRKGVFFFRHGCFSFLLFLFELTRRFFFSPTIKQNNPILNDPVSSKFTTIMSNEQILNPLTNRKIARFGRTHRKLLKDGQVSGSLTEDERVLAYINGMDEYDVKEMKKFYGIDNSLFSAVKGRGCFGGYLVKRYKNKKIREQ